MSHTWKLGAVCFMVLILVGTLGPSCGEETQQEDKVVITVGHLTDFTGPASPALIDLGWALEDLVEYINEEDPIPGVELKVVHYDTRYDPSRDIPGYEWCKQKGAAVMLTPLPTTGESLKLVAERDKVPVAAISTTSYMIDPPGWVFCFHTPSSWEMTSILKWVGDEWTQYPTKPKIGAVGWQEPWTTDLIMGLKDYCEAHPDKFEWIGGLFAPMGVLTWGAEVEKLRNCDYVAIPTTGLGAASFVRQFRERGYSATFMNADGISSFYDLLVDSCGWEDLDGTLNAQAWEWWGTPKPMIQLLERLLNENRPGDVEDVMARGCGYIGGSEVYLFFQVLRAAIEEAGAENFDGQAFFDTAIGFRTTWEGYPEMGFGQDRRWAVEYVRIWEWSASHHDLIAVSDWLPVIK